MPAKQQGGALTSRRDSARASAPGASGDVSRRSPSPSLRSKGGEAAPGRPAPGLYLVATPIGNARDVTLRALDVLAAADLVACEDTRVTARLLAIHDIRASLHAYHDHNAATAGPKLIERLKNGEIVALVSDAGTPLVSDPGYRLVGAAIEAGIAVVPVPGASAPLAALIVAGLPTDRFLFAGFPPPRRAARRRMLATLSGIEASLILLESPRRLALSLADMAEVFGPRPAAIGRELTKRFEEVTRGDLATLAARAAAAEPPKGEIVIVVAPPEPPAGETGDLDAALRAALEELSTRGAASVVAHLTGRPRRAIYARALELAGRR